MPECLVGSFYLDHCWFMELCGFHIVSAATALGMRLASAGLLALKGNKEPWDDSPCTQHKSQGTPVEANQFD